MAVSKKGKRRITVKGVKYLWWIFSEFDQSEFDRLQIKIISEDQIVYFKYGIEQNSENRSVVIALNQNQYMVQVICPKFEDDSGIIKPNGVKELINWSLEKPINAIADSIIHAYSPRIGIISKNKRLDTYRFILDEIIRVRKLKSED